MCAYSCYYPYILCTNSVFGKRVDSCVWIKKALSCTISSRYFQFDSAKFRARRIFRSSGWVKFIMPNTRCKILPNVNRATFYHFWRVRDPTSEPKRPFSCRFIRVTRVRGMEEGHFFLRPRWTRTCRPVPDGGSINAHPKKTLRIFAQHPHPCVARPFSRWRLFVSRASNAVCVSAKQTLCEDLQWSSLLICHVNKYRIDTPSRCSANYENRYFCDRRFKHFKDRKISGVGIHLHLDINVFRSFAFYSIVLN